MKMIELKCKECEKVFSRLEKEYRRCQKKGFSVTCSRACGAAARNRIHAKGNLANLRSDNRQDSNSPFKYYISKAYCQQKTSAYGQSNITLEYLKLLWDKQNGICPYTGKIMELPKNTTNAGIRGAPNKASLDRIDSSKGYVQGNVEFVCLAVNLAKQSFSKTQMLKFFQNVREQSVTSQS